MKKEELRILIKEELNKLFRGKFNSLKDLYLGIKHLFPNSQIDYYPNDIYSNDKNENVGYIGVKLNGSYHIIQHVPSEYGDGNIGLVWVDQRRDKRFEFSSLEELNDLINEK